MCTEWLVSHHILPSCSLVCRFVHCKTCSHKLNYLTLESHKTLFTQLWIVVLEVMLKLSILEHTSPTHSSLCVIVYCNAIVLAVFTAPPLPWHIHYNWAETCTLNSNSGKGNVSISQERKLTPYQMNRSFHTTYIHVSFQQCSFSFGENALKIFQFFISLL